MGDMAVVIIVVVGDMGPASSTMGGMAVVVDDNMGDMAQRH